MTARRLVYACVISAIGLSASDASASGELEKALQRPEVLPFVPLLWKNEGLLFTDILLQKLLLPFGLASPYTNLFVTEAVRDFMNELDLISGKLAPTVPRTFSTKRSTEIHLRMDFVVLLQQANPDAVYAGVICRSQPNLNKPFGRSPKAFMTSWEAMCST